jgi:asparaginyl-tRNA synthetase
MNKLQRTRIVDLLRSEDFGSLVQVKGWVRTRRGNKQVGFIALNDGSTIHNIQIVVELVSFDEELLKQLTTGACIRVDGILSESPAQGQKAEIQAQEIEVYGVADPNTYPLQKKGHTLEFLREIAHLRPRTLLEPFSGSGMKWPKPYIVFFTTTAFIISIRPLLLLPTAKVRGKCFR